MKALGCTIVAVLLLGTTSAGQYQIELTRYFSNTAAEARSRAKLIADANAFTGSVTPLTAQAMLRWLEKYDALLKNLERHDIYVYLRSEENENDTVDAKADDTLGALEDEISDRVVQAAEQLGPTRIATWTRTGPLREYRYLLEDSLVRAAHRLDAADARAVKVTVTPVLDAAAASYKALRKSSDPIRNHQEACAALLISIAAARNGLARLRGFAGAAQAAYFDKSISEASVERTLGAVRGSTAYAHYRKVAALAPKPGFTAPARTIGEAIPMILAAEQPMGTEYASAYAALLNPENHRIEICTLPECDDSGFSVGFAGVESGVYYGGYAGSVNAMRAVAHESGYAVHREFMSRNQAIAAYNNGPGFMFESFAIFNELLFLDHLYETAPNDEERAYFLNYYLSDATFQIFGSAEETELERAIYRGVDDRTIRTAADFDALTMKIFARYDPAAAQDAETALYWARDRLFFTDPLYDVNYLYAGLLALQYFVDFEHDPGSFSARYVALLKNGFNDTPAALEKRFLGIDLSDEAALVSNATRLIDARTAVLSKLYSNRAKTR